MLLRAPFPASYPVTQAIADWRFFSPQLSTFELAGHANLTYQAASRVVGTIGDEGTKVGRSGLPALGRALPWYPRHKR